MRAEELRAPDMLTTTGIALRISTHGKNALAHSYQAAGTEAPGRERARPTANGAAVAAMNAYPYWILRLAAAVSGSSPRTTLASEKPDKSANRPVRSNPT